MMRKRSSLSQKASSTEKQRATAMVKTAAPASACNRQPPTMIPSSSVQWTEPITPYLSSVRVRPIMGCRPYRVCGRLFFRAGEAMAGIARNIELYNSAYDLAWRRISEPQKRQPEIARRLHDSIRCQLSDGIAEPLFIASEALKALDEREPGTQQASLTKLRQQPPSNPRSWRRLLGLAFPLR
jgi:hypothetical protein